MSYTREMFESARNEIENRRVSSEDKAEKRRRDFEKKEPEYAVLRNTMISSVREAVKAINMKPEKAALFIEEQKEKNLSAQRRIKELLIKNNLPSDWLEVHYYCPVCSDTGFVGTKLCSCFTDLLKKKAFDEAGKKSPLKFCRFEDFRLDYYPTEINGEYGCSSRERMEGILAFCKGYADDFDRSSQSILMLGETGLGKTHLSLSIAGEVIGRGYNAVYNSAQNIFTELNKEHFGRSDISFSYEAMILDCDLLVIDDLGAEFATQFTNAALYNIINTRINYSLPTIINTNLSLKELEEKYTRRISSRIIGEYAVLDFFGYDIRQIKNEQ